MNTICLVMDRLQAGYLGAYGNTWIETPAIDRLASQSIVFDQMLIDSPRLESLYRSYWQGCHAMHRRKPEECPSLIGLLREKGVSTALLSDDRSVFSHPLAVEFDEVLEIDPPWQPHEAEQTDQTHLAQCFVEVLDYLETARQPFLLWCHLGSLGMTWDAPRKYREFYCEPGDPEPPQTAQVPDLRLPPDHDPDELLGMVQAYAGQISLLDTCFEALLEMLDSGPFSENTLFALTGARGFPLGEHGHLGPGDESLHGELVHVPMMLRFPDRLAATVRCQALVEPADLWATLLDCHGVTDPPPTPTARSLIPLVRGREAVHRDRLGLVGPGGDRAIRTPAWYLRIHETTELFVKPDDRWEVNDVADRAHDVVEKLQAALVDFEQYVETGGGQLRPLEPLLVDGLE